MMNRKDGRSPSAEYEAKMLKLFRNLNPEKQDDYISFLSWLSALSAPPPEESPLQGGDGPHQQPEEDE